MHNPQQANSATDQRETGSNAADWVALHQPDEEKMQHHFVCAPEDRGICSSHSLKQK
jgi:hypothetical protein